MRQNLLALAQMVSLRIRSASLHMEQFFLYQKLYKSNSNITIRYFMLTFRNLKVVRNEPNLTTPSGDNISLSRQFPKNKTRNLKYGTPNHHKQPFNKNNTKSTNDGLSKKDQNEGGIITEFELAQRNTFKSNLRKEMMSSMSLDQGAKKRGERCEGARITLLQFYEFLDKKRRIIQDCVRKVREEIINKYLTDHKLNSHQAMISFQQIKDIECNDSVLQEALKVHNQIQEFVSAIPMSYDTLHIEINQLNIRRVLSQALKSLQKAIQFQKQNGEALGRYLQGGGKHEGKNIKKIKRFKNLKTS